MKVFSPKQHEEALKWASELPARKQLPAGLAFIPTSKPDVMALEINGVITGGEMPQLVEKFDSFLKQHENVNMLLRFKHFGGYDPAILMHSGWISLKVAAIRKLERYAIIGAPQWMSKIIESTNPLFPEIDIRTFSENQESEAWDFVGAKPTS